MLLSRVIRYTAYVSYFLSRFGSGGGRRGAIDSLMLGQCWGILSARPARYWEAHNMRRVQVLGVI